MKNLCQLKKSGGYYKKVIRTFGNNLEHISAGYSLSQLLEGYFETRRGKKVLKEIKTILNPILDRKLSKLVQYLKEIHKNSKNNEKRIILSLLSKIFTKKELKELGFSFLSSQFTNSRKIKNISFIDKDQNKGRPKLEKKNNYSLIKKFAYQNTSPAANRTIIDPEGTGIAIPVRYVSCCYRCFYSLCIVRQSLKIID